MGEYIVKMPEEPAKVVRDGWNVRIEWQYEQREEILRCKDCEFYQPGMYKHFTCEYLHHWVKPYDFCAWGVRKERIEK